MSSMNWNRVSVESLGRSHGWETLDANPSKKQKKIPLVPTRPRCNAPMALRKGPFGEFLGCSRFKPVSRLQRTPPEEVI